MGYKPPLPPPFPHYSEWECEYCGSMNDTALRCSQCGAPRPSVISHILGSAELFTGCMVHSHTWPGTDPTDERYLAPFLRRTDYDH